jgi:hypothetical protein
MGYNILNFSNYSKERLQEGGLPFRTLWIAVFLSPRKAHAIFLTDADNNSFLRGTNL